RCARDGADNAGASPRTQSRATPPYRAGDVDIPIGPLAAILHTCGRSGHRKKRGRKARAARRTPWHKENGQAETTLAPAPVPSHLRVDGRGRPLLLNLIRSTAPRLRHQAPSPPNLNASPRCTTNDAALVLRPSQDTTRTNAAIRCAAWGSYPRVGSADRDG